jgi:PIN domain nuclease of toxin-antitoxin system
MVVLDTATLLFLTLDPAKLTTQAREVIQTAERLVISSISVWEIALKVKRSKLEISLPINEYVDSLYQLDSLEIIPVDVEAWLLAMNLDWDHRDPADRVIVATAELLKCPLVSSDRVIANFYEATVW